MVNELEQNNGEIIIYQSDVGKIRSDVRLENKTVRYREANGIQNMEAKLSERIKKPSKSNQIQYFFVSSSIVLR